MKRLSILVVMLWMMSMSTIVSAQDSACTVINETTRGVSALSFNSLTDALVIPNAMMMMDLVLNCESDADVLTTIDPAPAVDVNADAPREVNDDELIASQNGYAIVNAFAANLRSGDNPVYSIVGVVRGNDRLVVLGHNEDESWWYVQAGEIRGWIWSDLVFLRGDLTDVPVIATVGERTPATIVVGLDGNPIFDVLSLDGNIVCNIKGGREYVLYGRNSNTSYVWIQGECLDGTMAWGWFESQWGAIRNTGRVPVPVLNLDGSPRE